MPAGLKNEKEKQMGKKMATYLNIKYKTWHFFITNLHFLSFQYNDYKPANPITLYTFLWYNKIK